MSKDYHLLTHENCRCAIERSGPGRLTVSWCGCPSIVIKDSNGVVVYDRHYPGERLELSDLTKLEVSINRMKRTYDQELKNQLSEQPFFTLPLSVLIALLLLSICLIAFGRAGIFLAIALYLSFRLVKNLVLNKSTDTTDRVPALQNRPVEAAEINRARIEHGGTRHEKVTHSERALSGEYIRRGER